MLSWFLPYANFVLIQPPENFSEVSAWAFIWREKHQVALQSAQLSHTQVIRSPNFPYHILWFKCESMNPTLEKNFQWLSSNCFGYACSLKFAVLAYIRAFLDHSFTVTCKLIKKSAPSNNIKKYIMCWFWRDNNALWVCRWTIAVLY